MAPRISVLTTDDELLNGEMADTNTAAIARQLTAHGFVLRDSLSIRDETAGDLTAQAAAEAFDQPLEVNTEALAQYTRVRSTHDFLLKCPWMSSSRHRGNRCV